MSFNPTSPVTGAANTGFTSPTYTLTEDQTNLPNTRQFAVTALGGTQAGVSANVGSSPFTIAMVRPSTFVPRPTAVGVDLTPSPRGRKNRFKIILRKGMITLSGGSYTEVLLNIDEWAIPAGADYAAPAEIRGAFSMKAGVYFANAAAICDSMLQNVL